MPIVDVQDYDDVVVPFLDVAVTDDNESVIHSVRSSNSHLPSVTPEPRMNRARTPSLPAAVITTNEPSSVDDSDDDLSCTHSVRSIKTAGSGLQTSVRSTRSAFRRFSLGGELSVDDKVSRHQRERTIELATVVGDDSDVSEGDRVGFLEEEVRRLNSDLASSQSKQAIAKVKTRQLTMELEDLQAYVMRLQEENMKLKQDNLALKNGTKPKRGWFGRQPQQHQKEGSNDEDEEEESAVNPEECLDSIAATEESVFSEECNESKNSMCLEPEQPEETEGLSDKKDGKRPWWMFGGGKRPNNVDEEQLQEEDEEEEDEEEEEAEDETAEEQED